MTPYYFHHIKIIFFQFFIKKNATSQNTRSVICSCAVRRCRKFKKGFLKHFSSYIFQPYSMPPEAVL